MVSHAFILTLCIAGLAAPLAAAAQSVSAPSSPAKTRPADTATRYASHAEAMAFADAVAQRQGLPREWVREHIGRAQRLTAVQRLMAPAPASTAKNWAAYRERFVEPVRIAAGLRFWREHRETLARAEARWGVPAAIVVGIIGVETLYGRHTGSFRVLDALATLAFDFPASHPRAATRTEYFRGELEQLMRLAHRSNSDPGAWLGSYAGASGLPQFMPTSWEKYAVDFDGDGRIDLLGSPADAIGSVANYLHAFGWKTGMPTHYPARFDTTRLDLPTLLEPDILPTFSADTLQAKGVLLDEAARAHTGPLALVELLNGETAAPSHVVGTENFYAITRYNWSSYYALAVIELGQAIAHEMGR